MANETYTEHKVEPGARYREGERPSMGKLLLPMLLSLVLGFGLGWAMKPDRQVERTSPYGATTPYTAPGDMGTTAPGGMGTTTPGGTGLTDTTTTPDGGSTMSPGAGTTTSPEPSTTPGTTNP